MEIDSLLIRKSPLIVLTKMVIATVIIYLLYGIYSSFLAMNVDSSSPTFLWNRAVFFALSVGIEALVMMVLFLRWMYCTYTMSDTELSIRHGVLWRQTAIYSMRNIQSLHVNQSPIGTLLNFGTIKLQSPLTKGDIEIRHVADPQKYSQVLQRVIDTSASTTTFVSSKKN